MTPKVHMRVIRPRRVNYGAAIEAEIVATAEEAKQEMMAAYEEIQADWKPEHKAHIVGRKYVNSKEVRIVVTAEGGTLAWIDKGTPKRIIKARNAPYLVFRTGYQPKTLPGQGSASSLPRFLISGPSGAGGDWVRVRQVEHEIRPRKFTEHMAEVWRQEWPRRMDAAVKRGKRRAQGG